MSVKYNIVELGNPTNREASKKFYASIQSSGRLSLRQLAAIAADRSTLADQISTVLPRFNPGKQFKCMLDNIEFNKN